MLVNGDCVRPVEVDCWSSFFMPVSDSVLLPSINAVDPDVTISDQFDVVRVEEISERRMRQYVQLALPVVIGP